MSKTSSELSSPFATAPTVPAGADGIRDSLRGKHVCPFCGSVNDSDQGTCPRCTMENSAATRKATKTRIGPWYVLQTRNPAAPGMTWETLVGFVRKGRVKPRSIVRGPTTHQLWRFAAHVKGLSREFGICYSCGTSVDAAATVCRTCNRLQDPPPNPDALLETSRDAAGGAYAGPPPTIAGVVPPATVVDTVVAEVPPPPPEDAEFVIPPFDGGGAATASGGAAGANGGGGSGTSFQGLSGDTSWARIPNTPRERGPVGGQPNGFGQPNGYGQPNGGGQPAVSRGPVGRGANGAPAVNTQAPRFNPYDADEEVGGPATNRRGDGDAGFLSPKELAAAFNLSFVGEDEEAPVSHTERPGRNAPAAGRAAAPAARGPAAAAGARVNPAASSAAATAAMAASFAGGGSPQSPAGKAYRPPASARPRRSLFKIFVVLVLLGGAGLGVAVAVSPDFRKAVKEGIAKVTDGLNKPGEGDQVGSPGSSRDRSRRPAVDKKATPAESPDAAIDGEPPRSAGPSGGSDTQPAPTGAGVSPTASPPTGDPAPAAPPAPAAQAVPATPTPSTPTPSPTAPAGKNGGAAPGGQAVAKPSNGNPPGLTGEAWRQSEAYKLYNEAIGLEQTDPALALARYKSIKRQPREAWPSDLDSRIEKNEKELRRRLSE